MQIHQALIKGRQYLKQQNVASYSLDSQVLLSHITGLDRTGLITRGDQPLTPAQLQQYEKLLERRAGGEPVAYLTGHKEFMGLDFIVSPAVLIPRPDTELMVERAVSLLRQSGARPLPAVDVGTGSGAIAVTLAHLVPGLQVYAIDISPDALEVARQNAARHGVADRVKFCQGNLLEPIPADLQGKVSVITANLPYIPSGDISGLMTDVKDFEPHLALDGGPDGLALYRKLIPRAHRLLHPGGHLLMEIGPGQGAAAKALLPAASWTARLELDLAGRERLVEGEKR